MTIGQLVECILGKVSAIEGHDADGTPFNDIDITEIKDRLEKLGFHRDGIEVNDLIDESTNKRTKTNPNTQIKDRINTEIQNLRKLINDPMTPIMIRMIVGNKLDHFNGSNDVDLIKMINLSLDHISKELKEGCFDDLIDQIQIIVERISENVLNDLKK
jgi:hypothetical protein